MAKPLPPIDELFDRFYVDSTSPSGLRYVKNDKPVGTKPEGRWTTIIRGARYKVHRIVHVMRTGRDDTSLTVDHKDRNPSNNHPFNLRWLDAQGQAINRSAYGRSKLKGVRERRPGRYEAFITRNRKQTYLGTFDTPEQAHQAYLNAVRDAQQP